MCSYCGSLLNGNAYEITVDNTTMQMCDEHCAILYYQEQMQSGLHSWIKIR